MGLLRALKNMVGELSIPYSHAVARGGVHGASGFGSFGKLVTAGVVTNQVVWPNGAWLIPPQTGIQAEIVSDNAADDKDAGTGIRSVEVHYIGAGYEEKDITVELDGLTPATLTGVTDLIFVQCMHMVTFGSAKQAVGNITLREVGQTQAYSYIAAGENRCASSARMVPAGKRLLVTNAIGSSTSGTAAASTNIQIASTRFDAHDYKDDSVLIPFLNVGFQDGSLGSLIVPPLVFNEGDVVAMVASSDKAATISASWQGVLENDS